MIKPRTTIGARPQGASAVVIEGLLPAELNALLVAIRPGSQWVRVQDGRLLVAPAYEKLPDPVTDETMLPHWRAPTAYELQTINWRQPELFVLNNAPIILSASIIIEHLCGYDWSPLLYREEAEKLKSYGFEIMRSPRGKDGRYYELWRLPLLALAKGALREAVEAQPSTTDEHERLKRALDFLARNCSFGSLDVCVQRIASRPAE